MKEYADLVKEVKRRGGDFIKIMTTGIMNFDTDGSVTEEPLGFDEVKEMIHIAHEEGFSVMAHANGARAVREAALAGVDSIEHGNYVDEEAICAMKEHKTVWVPTITVVKNMIAAAGFPMKFWKRYGKQEAAIYKGDMRQVYSLLLAVMPELILCLMDQGIEK